MHAQLAHFAVAWGPLLAALFSGLMLQACGYHGPGSGEIAHVIVERAGERDATLEFCTPGGWKEVKSDETTVAASGRTVKVRASTGDLAKVHHFRPQVDTGCEQVFTFWPQVGERYRFTWSEQRRGCFVVLMRRPEDWAPSGHRNVAEQEAESWTLDDTIASANDRC
jgi:hypothetical protein